MTLSKKTTVKQSEGAFAQWGEIWDAHAKKAATYPQQTMDEFKSCGLGRVAVCLGNGYSLEENIEVIKEFKHNIDVIACDKVLGHCIKNGIKPKFIVLSDACVDAAKYFEPYRDQLGDTVLLANVCSNPDWWDRSAWKDIVFHVNMDVLGLEKRYAPLSGCPNLWPAATNVSNTCLVALTQYRNQGAVNFMEYDKIILIGYDYSWKHSYYAFDKEAGGKIRYMQQSYVVDGAGRDCFSSPNLLHSAQWLESYIRATGLPVRMGSRRSIIRSLPYADLKKELSYNYKPDDYPKLKNLIELRASLTKALQQTGETIDAIRYDHLLNIKRTASWV